MIGSASPVEYQASRAAGTFALNLIPLTLTSSR